MNPDCFRPLAGPYAEGERWMLEAVIADLNRGGIPWKLQSAGDNQVEIWRSVGGWREVEAEEVTEQ